MRSARARTSGETDTGGNLAAGGETLLHRLHDPGGDLRMGLLQATEVAAEQDERLRRRRRRHRRVPASISEDRDLAEEVTGPERREFAALIAHRRGSVGESEERVARGT